MIHSIKGFREIEIESNDTFSIFQCMNDFIHKYNMCHMSEIISSETKLVFVKNIEVIEKFLQSIKHNFFENLWDHT